MYIHIYIYIIVNAQINIAYHCIFVTWCFVASQQQRHKTLDRYIGTLQIHCKFTYYVSSIEIVIYVHISYM